MKNKTEKKLDEEFEQFGVKPRIYHFTEGIAPFAAITIAEDCQLSNRDSMRVVLDNVFKREYLWMRKCCPATRFIRGLALMHIYGVAICDKRDQFNRQRGRIIAKGRLLKHLKEDEDSVKGIILVKEKC